MDQDERPHEPIEESAPSRDVMTTVARWGREKGDVQVCNRLTGEVATISWNDLTDVWKEDLRRLRRSRAG